MATLKNTTINDTGYIRIANGTIAQRPGSPTAGMMRWNTDLGCTEYYNGSNWIDTRTSSPAVVTDNLQLYLDASNPASYPGQGNIWYDLGPNGYNFNINSNAWTVASGYSYMNFTSSTTGAAKYVVNRTLTNVPNFANATIMCFSTIITSTADWRTLLRGSSAGPDHQVIIQTGSNTLGMYDNQAGGFLSSGFSVTSIPNYSTAFNCLVWQIGNTSPYYRFRYNNSGVVGTITDANATFNNGFSTIGAYHSESILVTNNSQYWGNISVLLYYSKYLSDAEISQNYNAFRGRFGV